MIILSIYETLLHLMKRRSLSIFKMTMLWLDDCTPLHNLHIRFSVSLSDCDSWKYHNWRIGNRTNYFSNEVRMIVYIENVLVYLSVKIQGVNNMSSLYFSLNDENISSNFMSVKFSETIQIGYIVKDSNFGFSRDVTFILITGNEIGNVCIVAQCKYAPVLIK